MKSLELLDDIHLDLERYLDYLERDLQERIKNNESEISISEVNDARAILVTNMYYGYNEIKQDLKNKEKLEKSYDKLKVEIYDLKEELNKYKSAFKIVAPMINLGNNVEFGGNEYYLADDRRLHYITKEEYKLIEEVLEDA